MATAIRRTPVRLKFTDGQVTVTPQDMDTFVISAERAIEACKDAVKRDERIQQFQEEFLVPVHEWCLRHSRTVRLCTMPMPTGSIRIFVVTSSERFDFELAADTADLERALQNAGWSVSISQLPAAESDSLETFFSQDGALELYAQGG
jgi:hypothetical protein